MNTLKEYIQKNLIITNKEAEKLGYTRHNLSELTKIGQLERLRPGLYQLKGKVIDDFVLYHLIVIELYFPIKQPSTSTTYPTGHQMYSIYLYPKATMQAISKRGTKIYKFTM